MKKKKTAPYFHPLFCNEFYFSTNHPRLHNWIIPGVYRANHNNAKKFKALGARSGEKKKKKKRGKKREERKEELIRGALNSSPRARADRTRFLALRPSLVNTVPSCRDTFSRKITCALPCTGVLQVGRDATPTFNARSPFSWSVKPRYRACLLQIENTSRIFHQTVFGG